MTTSKLPGKTDQEEIDLHRRRFFGTTAITIAATELGLIDAAHAQSTMAPVAAPANDGSQQTIALVPANPKNTSFASLKQVNAGVLNIGYAEDGPADGQ